METIIDLQPFCCKSNQHVVGRMDIKSPFSRDGFTYATNGHIMIRVSGEHAEIRDNAPNEKHISKLWTEGREDKPFGPLPSWEPKYSECEQCEGIGKISQCDDCDGTGTIEFSRGVYEYEVDCKACADGYLPDPDGDICSACEGTGERDHTHKVSYATDTALNPMYLRLLQKLPNCEIESGESYVRPDPVTWPAIKFRFDGGEGFLMPMRDEGGRISS